VLAVILRGVDESARRGQIEKMQPNQIDAETRQRGGVNRRILLGGNLARAGTPFGEVESPKANGRAIALEQMSALGADETRFAGGCVEQKREIDQRVIAVAVIDRERLELDSRRAERTVNNLIRAESPRTSALSYCAICHKQDDQKNPA
jgi:hypothetical protein